MASGVTFDETYTDPYSDIGQLDVAVGLEADPARQRPAFRWPRHVFEQVLGLGKLDCRHGDRFSYRSIETEVLGFCMERVTGKRLPQIVSDEIWQPMGAEQSACFTVDPAGSALADGGFNACLRDYARVGLLYLAERWRHHSARLGGGDAQRQPCAFQRALHRLAAARAPIATSGGSRTRARAPSMRAACSAR